MIDPADKQTESLPLEQPKRGRGRPTTGQAMTPAEKQRAYRERLKSNVTKNEGEVRAARKLMVTAERARQNVVTQMNEKQDHIEQLEQQLAAATKRAESAERRADLAEAERDDMGNQLAVMKARKGNVTEKVNPLDAAAELIQYNAQSWNTKARKWKTIGEDDPENMPFDSWRHAETFVKELLEGGSPLRYRIVPANLPVKEYK